jgi:hypothetical protein
MVLLGTSAPLITRLASKPAQVGPAFYNGVTLPIGIFAALLLALTPYLGWRGAADKARARLLLASALAAVGTVMALGLGGHGVLYTVFLLASLFAVFSNALRTYDKTRERQLAAAGDHLAHVGLGLMLVGIIISSAWDRSEKVVLPLGESKQVLGYSLTFKGIDKPTPTSRDAVLVEVRDSDGRSYVARPLMYRNEKSNQMVANPDVRVGWTRDVYISPIEIDPGRPAESGQALEIGKGERTTIGSLQVTFESFDMGGAHSSGGRIAIGARLRVVAGGTESVLTPFLISGDGGFEAKPEAIPGLTGASVAVAGVNASQGRVRLSFTGIADGIATRAVLHQGETLSYRGVTLTFRGFDMSEFQPEAGKVNIGALFTLANGSELKPRVRGGGGGNESWEDIAITGLEGVRLRVYGMNAEERSVAIAVVDPQAPADRGEPMRFAADISVKPMIGLLWLGLIILLAGGLLAMVRRAAEFSRGASGTVSVDSGSSQA